ncbi:MAG: ZIP family metal transporter [Thermoleophilaceae bacterium]
MSLTNTIVLGALAGSTIFLGLPFARLRLLSTRARVGLAMFSVGVLAFLFVDVLGHATEVVKNAVTAYKHGHGSLGHAIALAALLGGAFALGSAGLAMLERRIRPSAPPAPPVAGGSVAAISASELARLKPDADEGRARALRTGMTIAAAIGMHNFAEGLAIGVSASTGEISLATVLIVGFALHNATEGFGIVGPLGSVRPSWRWIAAAGAIGGGPTFIGSIVGYNVNSPPLQLLFYAVSGGAILYVIGEVWNAMRRYGYRELGLCLLAAGLFAGIATDLIVSYGGG